MSQGNTYQSRMAAADVGAAARAVIGNAVIVKEL
jgi:hypothetical protein